MIKSGLIFSRKVLGKFQSYVDNALANMGEPKTNWTLFSWKSSLINLNLTTDVCFFGDSITRGAKFQDYFKDKRICNLGITGDTISGMTGRTDMVASVHPKKVFVMAGINDLISGKNPEQCVENYRFLLQGLQKDVPEAEIYVQSVLPINPEKYGKKIDLLRIVRFNDMLSAMSNECNVVFIDVYSEYEKNDKMPEELTVDGIHLRENAYEYWAKKIDSLV